jgi:hypothetical protein
VASYISAEEAAYVLALLQDPDPENKKSGLQRLCKLYRLGLMLRSPHVFRQNLNGLLFNESPKVRRWALNAIALAGKSVENLEGVLDCIERYRDDPEILVAGVPALFGLSTAREVSKLLRRRKIPLEGATLVASAQYSADHRGIIRRKRINIERADQLELRMAALLVGMSKAPENLFHSKYTNRIIIGQLNGHDDDLVAQYSVWAIAENPALGVGDLTIPLKDTESLPPNVRGWIYRLVTVDDATAAAHLEYIVLGSEDPSDEAREGLAIGIRNVFVDGMDETTFRWLPDEPIPRIRQRLLEHMAACAEKCPSYLTPVLQSYRESDRAAQIRLEGAAQGTSTYRELRRIAMATEQATLNLDGDGVRTMVTQYINTGGGSIGIVSGEGTVIAQSVEAITRMNDADALKPLLAEILKFISINVVDAGQQAIGAEAVKAVAVEPSKSKMQSIVDWLKMMKDGGGYLSAASHSIGDLIQQAEAAIHHLPSLPT